jgi:plasmid stabilization system protein ParE
MREVVYHPKVPTEAREALAYYDDISPNLGDEFWEELTTAIDYARDFPERHHFDQTGRRRSNLEKFPYHFLFRVFDTHIRITAIRHHSRDPGYGSRRQ